jgi:transposase
MVKQQYPVKLKRKELGSLKHLSKKGTVNVRVYKRAQALMLAHEGKKDEEIGRQVGLSRISVLKLRQRFEDERVGCIDDKPRSGRPVKFSGELRAKITAIACSEAPKGYAKWSLQLLADRVVELKLVEGIHRDTVGEILKKTKSNPKECAVGV